MASRRSVFAIGSVLVETIRSWSLYSFNRRTGLMEWAAPIPATVADSWSSAAIDEHLNRIMVGSGQAITCLDIQTGSLLWQRTLPQSIINASPCITQDRPLKNRLFITDYDGAGTGGNLYCINLDQFVPTINPYQPGEIVWTAQLSGTSGNTPAYHNGIVFVSSTGEYQVSPGSIQAFDVNSGCQLWCTQNDIFEGYFGGVGIHQEDGKRYVFASSYGFWGNIWASDTEKIDADSGTLVWTTKSNRSAAIPVVLSSSKVIMSGGVQGFGSMPTLQMATDKGWSAITNWTSMGTSRMGGWSIQPVFDQKNGRLYVGELPTTSGGFAAGIRMHVIETAPLIGSDQLEETIYSGFGSSPAIAGRNLYSIGALGLHAFGPTPVYGDVNDDGVLDVEDIYAYFWCGPVDVNGDGCLNSADLDVLHQLVRGDEVKFDENYRNGH